MKKMMLVAAAVLAGSAFAVESDVVGYSTITLRPGKRMCSTSFLRVTDQSGMTLADLKPIGYTSVAEWATNAKKGFKGWIMVKVLNNGGGLEKDASNKDMCYAFYAPWSKTAGWQDTYWTQVDATQVKIDDPTTVQFPVGTGLWIEVSDTAYDPASTGSQVYPDNQYQIQHSGSAMLEARSIDLRPGKKGVSITVSANITLANIHPTGYLTVPEWATNAKKGFKGWVMIKVLNNGGGLEKDANNKDMCYAFYAPWSKTAAWQDTYWTQVDATQVKIDDPTTVQFPIGTGLWIEVSDTAYDPGATGSQAYPDNQYKVEFDGIEDL